MSVRNTTRALLTVGVTLAVLLASAPLALAATANDTSQFAVTAGSMTFGTAPDVPSLPGLTLNGQSQTLNAQMNSFSVADATGSGSGWNLTVNGDGSAGKSAVFKQYCSNGGSACGSDAANSYVTAGATLAANSVTLSSTSAGFTAQNGTTGTAPTHQCGSACNVDSAAAVKIVSAASGAGMGTYQANGYLATGLALNAPTTIKSLPANEIYRVDLLWTLSSGP
jgi:hypothetical protein